MKFVKILFAGVFLSMLMSVSVSAQETALPDLYIEDFSFYDCDDETIGYQLENNVGNIEITNVADDNTYFDVTRSTFGLDSDHIPSIYRTYCYIYKVGNKGTASADSTWGESDGYVYDRVFISNDELSRDGSFGGGFVGLHLEPGETHIDTGYAQVNLNYYGAYGESCLGVTIDWEMENVCTNPEGCEHTPGIEELDETNNTEYLCFEVEEYSFPDAPQNVRAIKAEGDVLELTWDEVAGADFYEVYGYDLAPNSTIDKLSPTEVTGNTAVFDLPEGHLYNMSVMAVQDEVHGPITGGYYYNKDIYRFYDVPVSSWYFPYLQYIQAYGIMNGYQDENGNLTGEFGPENNLTVAECLKIAFITFESRIDLDEDVDALPEVYEELNAHWAEEYIRKGYFMNLTILEDLDSFDPNRSITRGEILEMFFEVTSKEISSYETYTANDIEGSKYADMIEFAYEKKYVSGYPDGSFQPESLLNRAEILKIVRNFKTTYYY